MQQELELAPDFAAELEELVSAEDFLEFFAIAYDDRVVRVNRLHILQRFHDYLARQAANLPPAADAQRAIYRLWLERAYQDFVHSNAQTEKVFQVFRNQPLPGGGTLTIVPLGKAFRPC